MPVVPYTIEELCEFFDVPVELVEEKHPVRAEVKKTEERNAQFLRYSLRPWLERQRNES